MGSDIILCMALIASFAFVIQFLLSILGSDLDTDIDIDSASDLSMSLSDIISFKGITHFILGYSWTTYFSGSHLVGVVIGSFFFIVLFYVYKLLLKLKQEMVYECPEDLNGREVEIVFRSGKNHYMVNISKNGRQEQTSTRWLISGKKLPENRLRHLSTLTSEISRYLTAVRTVPVISLTMLLRPSLRHWESLISFRLQIL